MNSIAKYSLKIILILGSLGGLFFATNCKHDSQQYKTNEDTFATYFSEVDYRLHGKVISKKLLKDFVGDFQDLYLVEVQVLSFKLRKNNLSAESSFFGVFDSIANKAYFISPMHDPLYKHDDFPKISVDTEYKRILGDNGLQQGLIISRKEDCDLWEALTEKENNNTIRF